MYDKSIEEKWQQHWQKVEAYKFVDDRKKPLYVIDTPPPYTNGVLHMGHVSDYSYIDMIARYKRMKGFNVFYPQGWDTMGFPTERTVEKKYGKGLSDAEFIKKCEELSTENLSAMRKQMIRMGYSMDMSHEYITMLKPYTAKVQLSLLLLYEKGLVYRGRHAVYWCPYCKTPIAREETEDKEEKTTLNYINFELADKSGTITIATTRPELLHACVALAVNPNDEKNKGYIGKKVIVPIFNREVEVIGDTDVEIGFGTGAEMICTFGDKKDLMLFHRHKLPEIQAIDEEGKLINAGKYNGLSINEARSAIISDLKQMGLLVKREEILHTVKVHDRCSNPIELLSSTQWFIKTTEFAEQIKKQANEIKWIPEFTKRYLLDWADYIDWDWVISRERRFDTPLPFWYCEDCGEIIPAKEEMLPVDPRVDKPPVEKCPKCGGKVVGAKQTCDVWVDSAITPLVIAGWPNEGYERYFPADLRVNATEIIRTWDFYTIFQTWALTGKIPFKTLFVHGLILAPDNKKMSKSLGNVIGPEELIEKYSADSVRMWAALSGAVGKDRALLFNDVKYAYSFLVKLFNSFEFIFKAIEGFDGSFEKEYLSSFDKYMLSRLNSLIKSVDKHYDEFDFFAAANELINFYWHEFCDYYIEEIKHVVYGKDEKRKRAVQYVLSEAADSMLRMLAPIVPHAAEELYTRLKKKSVHAQEFPKCNEELIDQKAEEEGLSLNEVISAVRKEKTKNGLALNYPLTAITINIPEKYYHLIEQNRADIAEICKVNEVKLGKAEELSVLINFSVEKS